MECLLRARTPVSVFDTCCRSLRVSMSIVFPMHTEAVLSLAVSLADWAVVDPPVVVHLKVLFHVAHMNSHFVA